jgi:hypothetical protein
MDQNSTALLGDFGSNVKRSRGVAIWLLQPNPIQLFTHSPIVSVVFIIYKLISTLAM